MDLKRKVNKNMKYYQKFIIILVLQQLIVTGLPEYDYGILTYLFVAGWYVCAAVGAIYIIDESQKIKLTRSE